MSRIGEQFAALKRQGKVALVPYVTAGDPRPEVTVPLLHALVSAGADLIELGVPFSDPIADGPVIQRATERALAHRVSLRRVLAMVEAFRRDDARTPLILMGYLNPIEVMGYEAFAGAAKSAGVDGVLVVDVPPEESHDLVQLLRGAGIDLIYLLAPTSTEERIRKIGAVASGFVYYVAVKGVTGAGHLNAEAVASKLAEIRPLIDLPLGVGFGIKDADSAGRVASVADAVIVGSAIVSRIEALQDEPEKIPETIGAFLQELRRGVDGAAGRGR